MAIASCFCCKVHYECCKCWFEREFNFSKSLLNVPNINPQTSAEWLSNAPKENVSKSWKFYKEKYVHAVHVAPPSPVASTSRPSTSLSLPSGIGLGIRDEYILKGSCHRSMRKNEAAHTLYLGFVKCDDRAKITRGHCSCVAGSGGLCNHVFALLYQMIDYFSDDLNEIPVDVSKTSMPQQWHIPRQEAVSSLPVMGTHFTRSETERLGTRKRPPVFCKLYDPRSPMMEAAFKPASVFDEVSRLSDQDDPPPFSYLLSDQDAPMEVSTPLGTLPLGSCLSYQLADHGKPKVKVVFSEEYFTIIHDKQCKGFPQIPCACGKYVVDIEETVLNELGVLIHLDSARELEKRTVQQHQCKEWHKQRKLRLTASKFGKVNKRVKEPNDSFLKSLFCCKDISHIRSVSHGQANEQSARNVYATECSKKIKNFRVFDSGLVVNPDFPFLGATPDGKVYDPSTKECFGLLEIKCPLVQKGLSLDEAVKSKGFYLLKEGDKYLLKKDHPHGYFEQVQGQLAITGLPWCDFVVYLTQLKEMAIIRIYFDEEYWNGLLLKLHNFFLKAIPFLKSLPA